MLSRYEILIGFVCALLVAASVLFSVDANRELAHREFEALAEESVEALDTRMQNYLHSLQATQAFVSASHHISRLEFKDYVERLKIAEFLPGINGVGFIAPVARSDADEFVETAKEDGYTDFKIHPPTTSEQMFVIQHIFPVAPNIQALGLDITFEDGRRMAAEAARDTGQAHLTPRLSLVQDAQQKAGFLLLLPLYSKMPEDGNASATQSDFKGWVYAPFVGDNLLSDLTAAQGRELELRVFDGTAPVADALIFESSAGVFEGANQSATFTVDKFGRPWTIEYASTPVFDARFRSIAPLVTFGIGVIVTIMLLTLIRNMRLRDEASRELAAVRQRQIAANEEQTRSITENNMTPMLVLDEQDKILSANKAACRCFGTSEKELIGRPISDYVSENVQNRRTTIHNADGCTKSGAHMVLNLQRNVWKTADGRLRVTAIIMDVTAEVAANEEIKRTKVIYDFALGGSRIGVFEVDLKTGQSEVSQTWREIMGLPKNGPEIDAQSVFLSRVHPDELKLLQDADRDCIQGKTRRSVAEYRMRFGSDQWRWMRSDAIVAERAPDGTALRLIGTQTDITDIRHARNALELRERQLTQVVEASPIGMFVLDKTGAFQNANEAFCFMCGVPESELLARYTIADFLATEDIQEIRLAIKEQIKDGSVTTYVKDYKLQCVDTGEKWGSFHISWSYDKNDSDYYYITQIIDVTEQKKVEQLKSEFVATVSHELRTPLTSIKAALALMDNSIGKTLAASDARLLEIASSNTDRLAAIVNDILDLEKVGSGGAAFDFRRVDLSGVIEEVAKQMAPFAQEHKNTIKVDFPDGRIFVEADDGRLKQVVTNLVSNACKFSDDASQIVVRTEIIDSYAIVYVQNWGEGIPNEFRNRVFGAFSQADGTDTRAKGGTGLGLNICKQIVERLSGKIGFESQMNGVTVFWFTCPLAENEVVQLSQQDVRAARASNAIR